MRYLVCAAVAAGLALAPTAGDAASMKKTHRAPHVRPVPGPPVVQGVPDMSGGNAAAAGNNANSMSGSNSAPDNGNGRTSGGFGGM
jgi:hypothetical protein